MTELLITPNYDRKTAKFKGNAAAGERISVTIENSSDIDTATLRLRVLSHDGRMLAVFAPNAEEGLGWSPAENGISCELSLDTVEMQKAVCGMCECTLPVVLDDPDNQKLWFKSECAFQGWPKLKGGESPYDLTSFPKLIDDWVRQLGDMVVSAKRVEGGVEILLWDGKGEKPKPVKIYNGDATKAEEAAKRASDSAAESLKNTKEAKKSAEEAAKESEAAKEAARSALDGIAKTDNSSAWNIEVGDIDEVAGADVTCSVRWIDEGDAMFEGRVGWYIDSCEFWAQLKDPATGYDAGYHFTINKLVFISDDENLDSFEVSVDTYNNDYNSGTYLTVHIKAKRDVYAKKGEPYVTKSYVNKKGGGGGDGGGTTDYNDLTNKPSINGVKVSGSKSAEEYGLATKRELNEVGAVAQEASDDASSAIGAVDGLRRTVAQKRDKTNNTAAADSVEFTEWKFHCDVPEIQAALDANPPSISYADPEGHDFLLHNIPPVDGYTIYGDPALGPAAGTLEDTAAVFTPYVNIDALTGPVVTATREKVVITKTGEPYVTPAGVKNIAIPKYKFVDAAIADGVLTVAPYTNAKLASDGTAFTVAVAEGDGKTRDCVLRVGCGETAPKITWGANFHPRTDAETDFACVSGKRNVYWISEYAPNEFVVAGWQETTGGNAP